jgi:hypothetical protein
MPSMWILPHEHKRLFGTPGKDLDMACQDPGDMEESETDVGDGDDLIEVTGKDLARRCLELVGVELGLAACGAVSRTISVLG